MIISALTWCLGRLTSLMFSITFSSGTYNKLFITLKLYSALLDMKKETLLAFPSHLSCKQGICNIPDNQVLCNEMFSQVCIFRCSRFHQTITCLCLPLPPFRYLQNQNRAIPPYLFHPSKPIPKDRIKNCISCIGFQTCRAQLII
jgi:hypothetical protein